CAVILVITLPLVFSILSRATPNTSQSISVRVAVLEFGQTPTAAHAAEKVRELFTSSNDFTLIDSDLARTAARGAGYNGSLNLSVEEARDIGAAIGCD